jgi:hypothetical protein
MKVERGRRKREEGEDEEEEEGEGGGGERERMRRRRREKEEGGGGGGGEGGGGRLEWRLVPGTNEVHEFLSIGVFFPGPVTLLFFRGNGVSELKWVHESEGINFFFLLAWRSKKNNCR